MENTGKRMQRAAPIANLVLVHTHVVKIQKGMLMKSASRQMYLTMHVHVDPSKSSCSSVYNRIFCSWSSWSQYNKPCRSRPTGCSRILSGSSSFIAVLNFKFSSN